MTSRYDTISFLSDYGTGDEFVGVVKSVIRSIAPHVGVVDVTHDLAPHDVRAAGLTLARSAQYLCPGVVVGAVDPGAGTDRRNVAIDVGNGASVLVGPDNGLFAAAVALVGGATDAVELTNPEFHLESFGQTLDAGRDIYAPVAAHLCNGVPLDALGDKLDSALLMPGVLPVSEISGDIVSTEVLWVDRFGNAQLNVGADDLVSGGVLRIETDDVSRVLIRATAFDSIGAGAVGLLTDSYGLLTVAVQRGSAAQELGLRPGDVVRLVPAGESAGSTTSVAITSRPEPDPASGGDNA